MKNYLKQFGVWAIALREKYKTDLFFRTTTHIILLQVGFVLICTGAFELAQHFTNKGWQILTILTFTAIVFGTLLTRVTLGPARKSLQYQKRFVSNIAHELRTPLSTIKLSIEVALLDENLPADARKTYIDILVELDRISEVINNLLSLSSLTRPERMSFKNVDLESLINKVVKGKAVLARERGVEIIIRRSKDHTVWGNEIGLEQVFRNILKNAISYTEKDSRGTVVVEVKPDHEGMTVVSVADTGIGISEEGLFHILEPFYRADTSRVRKDKTSGSGLGLTIVNEIVRAHHGKLSILSTVGKGTTVSVYLPSGNRPEGEKGDSSSGGGSEVFVDFTKGVADLSA